MKKILVIVCVCSATFAFGQNWHREIGVNYTYGNASGGMGQIIDQAHGASFGGGLVSPNHRFAVGIQLSIAEYGRDKSRQEYTFDDGTIAPMDIIVSNTFTTTMAYGRWYMSTGTVQPYLSARAGFARYNTHLSIYDPDDLDHCEPVDRDILSNDYALVVSIGAGVRFDLSKIFGKLESRKFFFETNYHLTQGGAVKYMNADAPSHHQIPDADVVSAKFINHNTMVVHRHHVGMLYRNPITMSEVKAGVMMVISR